MIEAVERYYSAGNANIHRGVYQLSQTATHLYEAARVTVAKFSKRGGRQGSDLHPRHPPSRSTWLRRRGDVRIFPPATKSSFRRWNTTRTSCPWQMACAATGAMLRVIPMNDAGELWMDEFARLLSSRTKMVAVTHLSNSLGTVNDVKAITRAAHAVGSAVLIDGAQWVAHYPTDVRDLDCDFYVFSGHKLYGPTGIGVLYGKRAVLEAMPPWQGGGDMIESVTFEKTTYAGLPNKFEAGTPEHRRSGWGWALLWNI